MAEDDSPFDDLDADAYTDREGDPFAHLGADEPDAAGHENIEEATGGDDGEDATRSEDSGDDRRDPDPFEYLGSSPLGGSDGDTSGGEDAGDSQDGAADDPHGAPETAGGGPFDDTDADRGDPFDDAAADRGDPFSSAGNPFERVDVEAVDPDEVWERFAAEAAAAADADDSGLLDGATGSGDVGADAADGAEADPDDADVVTVSKHRYCETCPHFSPPPAISCGHPGTRIIEFVGTDEVQIADCPVVRERRELGEVVE